MKNGDFLLIDFVGRVEGTNQVFDFTTEDVAKSEKIHEHGRTYSPALVIIGASMVIPGVEKQLLHLKVGEEKEFTVPPEEAFGPRVIHMVRLLPFSAFLKGNLNPTPGARVEIDGRQGKIQSVSSGRVRVDFNHPLAGKKLHYWLKVVKQLTDTKEKAEKIFTTFSIPYPFTLDAGELKVSPLEGKPIPHEVCMVITDMITKWMKEITRVSFVEQTTPEPKKNSE